MLLISKIDCLKNVDGTEPQAISGAYGLNWQGRSAARGSQPSCEVLSLHTNTDPKSSHETRHPSCVVRHRCLDQVRERIRYKHYSLRTDLGHSIAPFSLRQRRCVLALTDCSVSTDVNRISEKAPFTRDLEFSS